jgi:hypothetical protein
VWKKPLEVPSNVQRYLIFLKIRTRERGSEGEREMKRKEGRDRNLTNKLKMNY